ncbi:MAG: hypothetical protein ACYCX7_02645, partial [Solirubrobacteraceae bacterium]
SGKDSSGKDGSSTDSSGEDSSGEDSSSKDSSGEDSSGETDAAAQSAATPRVGEAPAAGGGRDADEPAADGRAGKERSGRLAAPSPWAIALAVLAVLAFGVVIGTVVGKRRQHPAILLADEPSGTTPVPRSSPAASSGPTKGEPTNAKRTEPTAEPEPEPEASEETGANEETEAARAEEAEGASEGARESGGGKGSKSGSKGSGGSGSIRGAGTEGEGEATGSLPPVKHVFLIVLGQQGYNAAWGASSKAPYLASTLRKQGELIDNFYAIGASELANGVALISGQGPTPQTQEDCPTYETLSPGAAGKEGQALGAGCVYPASTPTLPGELEKAGLTWKAYIQGLEEGEGATPKSCRHPAGGEADPFHEPSASAAYTTWRNPFVYFASITESKTCASDDVGLERLASDLKSSSTTPTFSYIAADACDDGSEAPCAPSKPSGLAPMDKFLEEVVPEIERSGAYREDGLIAITFAEAPQSGPTADTSGCCIASRYPNLEGASTTSTTTGVGATTGEGTKTRGSATSSTSATTPAASSSSATSATTSSATTSSTTTSSTTSTATSASGGLGGSPPGGGRVGLLLISQFVKPESTEVTGEYNHFSLLLSIESLFKLHPLGYTGNPGLLSFEHSVYTAYK